MTDQDARVAGGFGTEDADGSAGAPEAVDGRTSRRARNRASVIDAALALYDEERFPFTLHDVAERSGVSVRSIYRYFPSLEELIHAAAAVRMSSLGDLIDIFDPGDMNLAGRVERFLMSRVALLETVRPIRALNQIAAPTSDPGVLRVRRFVQERMDEQFSTVFGPELHSMSPERRRHVTMTVNTLMLPAAIVYRRADLGLSIEESRAMIADVLTLLLEEGQDR